MEFNTTKNPRASEDLERAPAPENGRHLRKRAAQKLPRNHSVSRRLSTLLSLLGRFAFLILAVVLVLSIFNYANTSEVFRLRNISFRGYKHSDIAGLERTIRDTFPSNLLKIDLKKLRDRLEQETWARRVEIRRILPSDLTVHIQERVPSVILELKGELMLADDDGVLLDRYGPKYGKLDVPVFRGFLGTTSEGYRAQHQENASRVRLGKKMLAELEAGSPAFSRSISEVDLSDKSNVRVLLIDDTAEVFLGDRDFLKRFRTLMANMAQYQELKSQHNEIVSVDLRFDGQIIYRPRRGAESEAIEQRANR